VQKGRRTTQRYRRSVLWACEKFSDLSAVRRAYRCSAGFLQTMLYEQLELRRRRDLSYPWPKVIGIDEHFFRRTGAFRQFATVVVDYKGRCLREVVEGKTMAALEVALKDIPGRQNVLYV